MLSYLILYLYCKVLLFLSTESIYWRLSRVFSKTTVQICGTGEDSWESLGLQGDPTSPSWRRSVLGVHWRTDVEAETPILWPPHAKSWLIGKDPDTGRGWGQEEKGTTEDETAGRHHRLKGLGGLRQLVMDR